MMTYLDTIREHLLERIGSLELVPIVTIGFQPDAPDVVVTLLESSGGAGLHEISGTRPVWENVMLQALTRANSYPEAHELAMQVQEALRPFMLAQGEIARLKPEQSPTHIGQDERERVLFSQNFRLWLERIAPALAQAGGME